MQLAYSRKLLNLLNEARITFSRWHTSKGWYFRNLKGITSLLTLFGVSKATINFTIDIVNFIDQYPGMRKSSISLFYLNNNFRMIKMFAKNMLANFSNMFLVDIFYYSKVNPFQVSALLIEKGSWSLLAKIGTSLFRMSLLHSWFLYIFLARTNYLVFL